MTLLKGMENTELREKIFFRLRYNFIIIPRIFAKIKSTLIRKHIYSYYSMENFIDCDKTNEMKNNILSDFFESILFSLQRDIKCKLCRTKLRVWLLVPVQAVRGMNTIEFIWKNEYKLCFRRYLGKVECENRRIITKLFAVERFLKTVVSMTSTEWWYKFQGLMSFAGSSNFDNVIST